MKKKWFLYPIVILLSYLGFYIINNFFTIEPDVISGNGNPGLIIIILFSPIFVIGYLLTYQLSREISFNLLNKFQKLLILFFLFFSSILLIITIIYCANDLIISLGGPPNDPNSRIYRFGWFNQYTNSIYFNFYTFLLTHIIAAMIGILSTFKIQLKPG